MEQKTIRIKANITKMAMFTDIHFGAKQNSTGHNQDCLLYIDWFCNKVKQDKDIDAICFLGDWNENRSALDIDTLNYSYRGAKQLNELGLPIYFVIGNHDLYHRHTREVHSIIPFHEFSNFTVIEENTIVQNKNQDDILMCPFLFHDEYPSLVQYNKVPIWLGHFEFKGFVITGNTVKMPTGPDPELFKDTKLIFSGHFHKRQFSNNSNIVYIGNAFPTNFGDAGDDQRGMAIYDMGKEQVMFENWDECPRYIKTTLTDILDGTTPLIENARVKCVIDVPISFEESAALKTTFTEKYKLREFTLEESYEIKAAMMGEDMEVDLDDKLASVDELVIIMLDDIDSKHIDNSILIDIYNGL